MPGFSELVGRLAEDVVVRGRQFERIVRWWLLHDPVYRTQIKKVWLWDEWPGRWGPDAGIDLVAEGASGELWAIQAKAYAPEYTITKRDVDSFLAEASRSQFSYRLLVATTNRIGRRALKTLEEGLPAGLKLAADLDKAQLVWPASPDDLRAPPPEPKDPFPHNREAIEAVLSGFQESDRGQLLMACGTGKTLVGLWVSEGLECRRTLVLVPSLSLLAQTLREWTANASKGFRFLPVCSDETVRGEDHLVSHTAELGMPVTTDPAEIASFMRKRGPSVVFSTYQSSPRIEEALAMARVPGFDLAIADEAHRVAGPVSSDFATVLDGEAIRSKHRLFMTATPRFFTGRIRQEARKAEFEVASMDDHTAFGPVFHRLSFGDAIERDLLTDYQVAVIGIDDPTYRAYVENAEFVTRDGKEVLDARTLASHIGLAKAMHRFDLRRTISFHSRIAKARRFAEEFPEVVEWMPEDEQPHGELVCDFVSGEMSAGQREIRLDRLRFLEDDERALLSNARCLGEGVDVPALDGVAFIDPKGSLIDIIQSVGRAIRKAADKKVGSIVLPVFIEPSGSPDEALDSSAFKPIWTVLNALRAHDETLAEELDALRRRLGGKAGPVSRPRKFVLDVPASVGQEFSSAFDVRLVEQTTANFEFWLGLLDSFVRREGHSMVPVKHLEEGHSLGVFAARMRVLYGSGTEGMVRGDRRGKSRVVLSEDRIRKLESIEHWVWDVPEAQWVQALGVLAEFITREGHSRVPQSFRMSGFGLGGWVSRQRSEYKRGELESERITALESLSGWSWDPASDEWESAFEKLLAYTTREGHALVPTIHREDGFRLGPWVVRQRVSYRNGDLSDEYAERLSRLPGWEWDPLQAAWRRAFSLLQTFADREGHAVVPASHVESGLRLGGWVSEQRIAHKKGKLDPERKQALESLPGWSWDPSEDKWQAAFAVLASFADSNGHCQVPRGLNLDGIRLGAWVARQRELHHEGRLERSRRRQLEGLSSWAWDQDSQWDRAMELLHGFVRREGHSRVPQAHKEHGFSLGSWVGRQRQDHKAHRLASEQMAALEALPQWSWDPEADRWDEAYQLLAAFTRREGHARPLAKHIEQGFKLGGWVARQRAAFREGILDERKASQLELLRGWVWDARSQRGERPSQWEEKFDILVAFAEREGHAHPVGRHVEQGQRIGDWVARQRRAYREKRLAPERVRRLEALPGWTWTAVPS